MKKIALSIFLILGLLPFTIFGQGLVSNSKPLANVKLYKTEIITLQDFNVQLERLSKQKKALETLDSLGLVQNGKNMLQNPADLLEHEIEMILVRQEAEHEKITIGENELQGVINTQKRQLGSNVSDQVFEQYITQQLGIDLDTYKRVLTDSLLQTKLVGKKRPDLKDMTFPVSEEEIQDVYEQKASEFIIPRLVRFQFLMIDTSKMTGDQKKTAMDRMSSFSKRIKSEGKAAFDALIKASVDDPSYSGGDIGTYVTKADPRIKGYFGQDFINTLFSMKEGDISPVLETNIGYLIAYVSYRKEVYLPALNDAIRPGENTTVRDAIAAAIRQQKGTLEIQKASADMIKKLKAQASIIKFEKNYPW